MKSIGITPTRRSAGRLLADRPLDRQEGLAQVVALELGLLRHPVLPHVVGDFVSAFRSGAQGVGVELADAARREDGRLDPVAVEQLDQPPDADPATELALGELRRRLVHQAAQQHGVEVGREVDGDSRTVGPLDAVDHLVPGTVVGGPRLQRGNVMFQTIDLQIIDLRGVHRAYS